MTERFHAQVILCWPSDRDAVAELNARIGPDQKFSPTVEHSLSTCDGCRRGIWIAQQQQDLIDSPFITAHKLCMHCAGDLAGALNLSPHKVDLNPDLHHAHRRV